MAKAFPLQVLLDHARHRMEAAERLLRILKKREDAARARLDELGGFKREYQQRLTGSGARGMEIHLLRDFHVFLGKLDLAIRQQGEEVDKAQAHWRSAQDSWFELRAKVKAYETLASRHQARELAREEKRDQRQTDETALRRHLHAEGPLK
ncbi:MAG: flagellar export protein FliJ [Pseudomonadota bacterium]